MEKKFILFMSMSYSFKVFSILGSGTIQSSATAEYITRLIMGKKKDTTTPAKYNSRDKFILLSLL